MPLTALYCAHGAPELYAIVREGLPEDVLLLTLDSRDPAEYRQKLAQADVVILGAKLDAEAIGMATRLRLVLHQGVGYQDTVDLPAMAARGIRLATTPQGTVRGVAEHTVMLMLAACKHLAFADSELRQGRFHVQALRPRSRQLTGKHIGYVGMGAIGREVAGLLRAFGTTGIYCDPNQALPPEAEQELGLRRGSLDEVLRSCDILTLHVPRTAETRHLIDAKAIAKLQPGSILVNTARGGIVDEVALHAALSSGHILAAGLDVFEAEPLPADHPLARLPNVVLTPHISAGTADAMREKMLTISENLNRFRRGEPLRNEIHL